MLLHDMKVYSWDEVQEHNSAQSCWVVIHGRVHDMTAFVQRHPGGWMILLGAGRDASALYESHHPSFMTGTKTSTFLDEYCIGTVANDPPERPDQQYRFSSSFYTTVKQRAEAYFEQTGQPRRDVPAMFVQTVFTLTLWLALYFCTFHLLNQENSACLHALFAAGYGLAIALVGANVMHDGNHGGYSKSPLVNRVAGMAMDMIGASSFVWQQIHDIGHHTHTAVDELDCDIGVKEPHFRRIKASQRWFPHYAYQHIYLALLYSVLLLEMFFRDFVAVARGSYLGVRFQPMSTIEWGLFVAAKIGFLLMHAFMPLAVWGLSLHRWLLVTAVFLAVGSYTLVLLFQVNHVVPKAKLYHRDPVTGKIDEDWATMQLRGSCNFSTGSTFWNYFSGGLNHQIEHHLFPAVCHVHYPQLAKIVQRTAKEYGLEYNEYPTWAAAIAGHWSLLRQLGPQSRPKMH